MRHAQVGDEFVQAGRVSEDLAERRQKGGGVERGGQAPLVHVPVEPDGFEVEAALVPERAVETAATVYGAAKAGLLSYARGLTYELKDRGVRVNGLSPGPTVTNALAPLGPERQAAVCEELRRTVPLHRLGTATELAKAAVYLASDESAYTAGTVLRVDGGIGELAY
ncbi:SDR family oxidoreductase [Streptomyces sp. NPDC016845]|uniref:SDR family oxidoreductase n=1 Tax=Streptomyces sp. NPDC016845 TaxID=3364972 RepID=UPI00379DA30B